MMFRGFLYLLAGIAVAFSGFRALRGKRRHGERHRSRQSADYKTWGVLLLISAALLIFLGSRLLIIGLRTSP
jgi:hypothetical protein